MLSCFVYLWGWGLGGLGCGGGYGGVYGVVVGGED